LACSGQQAMAFHLHRLPSSSSVALASQVQHYLQVRCCSERVQLRLQTVRELPRSDLLHLHQKRGVVEMGGVRLGLCRDVVE
jgi:hypothetical protein